jgi:hypothetical protein
MYYWDSERLAEMFFGYHRDVSIALLTAAQRRFAKTNLTKESTRRRFFSGSPWWADALKLRQRIK